ncbi:hypothetical protein HN385_07445 [archaeon]|jgi:hypothetical protein|nr:hypothetical protein [archaeon]MBT3451440.1 hypothetical protein [archaeon]MBT6869720.1 hypothetical protein [archaeon]MBT7192649.1 hypothetical protein [archaeon]MBT7380534.1 hypothetical protein [archaeon]
MRNSKLKLVLSAVAVLLLLLSYLNVLFNFSGKLLALESVGLIILSLFAIFGLGSSRSNCGSKCLFTLGTLNVINIILLWYIVNIFSVLIFVTTMFLLVVTFPKRSNFCSCSDYCDEPMCDIKIVEPMSQDINQGTHSMVFPVNDKEKSKVKKSALKKEVNYVASNRSKIYHKPSCDWAKKINPKGKLTFENKEDAWEKGYRAHSCAK